MARQARSDGSAEGVQVTEVTSTPSSLSGVASGDVLEQLEFSTALADVARRAVSALGARRVQARLPCADVAWVAEELATTAELAVLLRREDPFRPEPVPDLAATFAVLDVGGSVLEGPQLLELAWVAAAARTLARELARIQEAAPRVAALAVEPPPRTFEQAVARALDADGAVRDDASPQLKRARTRVRETRRRLVALLESLLGRLDAADRGSEATVTLRDGRYVIPVRRGGGGGHVAGIVHGVSGSGATLFVEPPEAVELGNELRDCEEDEVRAVLAVLRGLTEQARAARAEIAGGWEMCIAVDDVYARARYAVDVDGLPPTMAAAPAPLTIHAGRHPLLIGEGTEVVPFDLRLVEGGTLVVSGPNTGGKTVLLKAVGLCAALAQAGVVPAVGEGTRLPVFTRVFADIGDHQSIAASLSTFSAHVAAVRGILEQADAGSLVLVDEIGGGTDPVEGGALATATLLALVRRGVMTMVTTHLAQLKELAAAHAGVENASLEFDAASLTPTYRFLQGVPGRSYGLAVARRLGIAPDVLAAAEAALPTSQRTLEALLADLEVKTQAAERHAAELARAEERLQTERQTLERRAAALGEREAAAEERQRELERSAREQARQFLLEARRRVEEALALARAAVSEATAKEARRLVEQGVQQEAEALKKLEQEAGKKGWRVRTGSGTRDAGSTRPNPEVVSTSRFPLPASRTEVDLRGLTVDEATSAVTAALDAAVVEDLPYLRIIHGKGTGALRSAVRRLLEHDARVGAFRLAPPREGGAGVTVVELKA
jgi:DNA mismatch repair protein MutS2